MAEKIKLTDSGSDIAFKMSEGNPGALNCIMEVFKASNLHDGMHGAMLILYCDSLGLYGSELYMLWNDCCDRDIKKFELVLRNWQMGKLSKETILANVRSFGRGKPFGGLVPLEELFSKLSAADQ